MVQFSLRSTPAVRSAFTVIFNNFHSGSSVNTPQEGSMYTVVWYGDSPLNSGSLLAYKQILQIFQFHCHLTLAILPTTYSVYTHFKAKLVHFTWIPSSTGYTMSLQNTSLSEKGLKTPSFYIFSKMILIWFLPCLLP